MFTGEHDQDEFLVCPNVPNTVAELRERMHQRAAVRPGSYAYRLIYDLHTAIFVQSIDLKVDYEIYFAREYDSFAEYLRRRESFPSAVVVKLAKSFDLCSGIYHFRPSYGFLADTYGVEFLTRLVEDSHGDDRT